MKRLLLIIVFMAGMRTTQAQTVQQYADFQLRLQPNPAVRYVEVRFVVPAGTATVAIFNVLGQKIKPAVQVNTTGGETTLPMDLSGLPHGVYLVRVQHGNQSAIRRLTIQ